MLGSFCKTAAIYKKNKLTVKLKVNMLATWKYMINFWVIQQFAVKTTKWLFDKFSNLSICCNRPIAICSKTIYIYFYIYFTNLTFC